MSTNINFLYDAVRDSFEHDCRKHNLAPDAEVFATEQINAMTNNELLLAISWALTDFMSEAIQ
jgi:hypothetical protein